MLAGAALAAGLRVTSEPGGAAPEILHRARFLADALPPGEGSPTYSGATAWISHLLALVAVIARWFAGSPPWASFWPAVEPALENLVLWSWCALSATILLLACAFTWPRDGTLPARRRWLPGAVTAAVLLAAPGPRALTAQASPAIPAALLLLVLARRAGGLARRPSGSSDAVVMGTQDGVVLGAVLAWAGFVWPVVPVFWIVCAVRRAPRLRLVSSVLVAFVLGLALEPARLVGIGEAGARLWVEWARGGGWPLSDLRSRPDVAGLLFAAGAIGWVAVPLALAAAAFSVLERRWTHASWFGLVWAVLALAPVLAGVSRPGAAQLAFLPLAVVAASQLVAGEARERRHFPAVPAGQVFRISAAVVLALSAVWAAVRKPPGPDPVALGTQIAHQIEAVVGEAPWISERALPGSVPLPGHGFLLPRDSREPARYDFASWPRWYASVRFVLVALESPPGGRFGAHLRGQLAAQARPLAQFGDPPRFLLYQVLEGTEWTQPLTREELAGLESGPDLGPFLAGLGAFYAEAGARRNAIVLLEEGLRVAPETEALYNNLGSVYLLEGEWEAAARVIGQGLERNPDSAELLYNYGRAHLELGSAARAEDLYRRVLALRPDFAEAHYEIARAFLSQEKQNLAAMALRRYLELAPGSPRRAAVEGVLRQLEPEPAP